MRKNLFLMLTLLLLSAVSMNAQVNIGSVNDPHKGALLDLSQNSSELGVLFPNVYIFNTKQFQLNEDEKVNPTGMVVYNSNASLPDGMGLYAWNGSEWKSMGGGGSTRSCIPVTATSTTSKTGTNAKITVTVTDGNPTYSYIWSKGGSTVQTKTNVTATSDTYTTTGAGTYTCTVSNPCTATPISFTFDVDASGNALKENGNGTYTDPEGNLVYNGETYEPVESDIPGVYIDESGDIVYVGADGIPGTEDDDTFVAPDYPIGRQDILFRIEYPLCNRLLQGGTYQVRLDFADGPGSYTGKIKYLTTNPLAATISASGELSLTESGEPATFIAILEDGSIASKSFTVVNSTATSPLGGVEALDMTMSINTIRAIGGGFVTAIGGNTVTDGQEITYSNFQANGTGSSLVGGWLLAGSNPGQVTLTVTATNLEGTEFQKSITVTILGTPSLEPLPYQTTTATAGKWANLDPAPAYAGGDGSEANPYQISSLRQLKKLSVDIEIIGGVETTYEQYFELTTDLNFTGDDSVLTNLVGTFYGTLDGRGHVIKNLDMGDSEQLYVMPFRGLQYAELKNLGREGGSTVGKTYAAGLAGGLNNAKLTKCFNSSSIQAEGNAGGLYYNNSSGNATVEDCYNIGNITTTTSSYVGGLCYSNQSLVLKNFYNAGNVTAATGTVAGIMGSGSGNNSFENCFNLGEITTLANSNSIGAIIGRVNTTVTQTFNNVYTRPNVVKKNTSDLVDYLIGWNGSTEQTYVNTILLANPTLKADEKYSVEYCQSPAFAAELGSAFKYANGRTPKLAWEK
jgi:hypothetical protein